jgi:hypothetical protein
MLTFEKVEASYGMGAQLNAFRARVPGGWLVMVAWAAAASGSASVTFLPDPSHSWDGSSLPETDAPPARNGP